MSSTTQRPIPSRMMLQTLKVRKKGAQQGYSLLKKKSDAMTARFRKMLKEIIQTKEEMVDQLREAAFTLAKAKYVAGEFSNRIVEAVRRPGVILKLSTDNIAGVKLPHFSIEKDHSVDVIQNIGCAAGGQAIITARDHFMHALIALVRLATLQTAFFTLDEEIRMTNRRVNALNNVVIPRIEDGIVYISRELDELEREEFFRLKKIQAKKKEHAERDKKYAEEHGLIGGRFSKQPESVSLIGTRDEDIIF